MHWLNLKKENPDINGRESENIIFRKRQKALTDKERDKKTTDFVEKETENIMQRGKLLLIPVAFLSEESCFEEETRWAHPRVHTLYPTCSVHFLEAPYLC